MARLFFAAALTATACCLLGCVSADGDGDAIDDGVGPATAPIVGGARDYTHDAVVAIVGPEHACTATIVATRPPALYLLTAAHCVAPVAPTDPELALLGADYAQPSASFPIEHCTPDPRYDGEHHDFAMCRAQGANAATPVLPIEAEPDHLEEGARVRHVGYGVTGSEELNTERFEVVTELAAVEPLLLWYDQQTGGPCSGDSGGPQLSLDPPERVVGVTSFGDADCVSYGASGRVAAVARSFILPFIALGEGGGAGGADAAEPEGGAGGALAAGGQPPKDDDAQPVGLLQEDQSYRAIDGCSLAPVGARGAGGWPAAVLAAWLLTHRRRWPR